MIFMSLENAVLLIYLTYSLWNLHFILFGARLLLLKDYNFNESIGYIS